MLIKVMSNQLTSVLFSLNLAITLFNKQHINTFVWITDSNLHSKEVSKTAPTAAQPLGCGHHSTSDCGRARAWLTEDKIPPQMWEQIIQKWKHAKVKDPATVLWCVRLRTTRRSVTSLGAPAPLSSPPVHSVSLFTLARGLRRDVRAEPTARASRLLQICDTHGPFKQWLGGLMI